MKRAALFLIPLLALSAATAHADSLQNLSNAQDSRQVAEGTVKVVAGAVAIPFLVVGGVSAAPGVALAASTYDNNPGLSSVGAVAAVPGAIVAAPGLGLMYFARQPLSVSPETMTAHPAKPAPAEDKHQ